MRRERQCREREGSESRQGEGGRQRGGWLCWTVKGLGRAPQSALELLGQEQGKASICGMSAARIGAADGCVFVEM